MIERKTFTYDGQNSADFGLYIAGDSVYDAPTRDMDMITIPGRNGQLSIDQGRFENITVTYPAFVWADTQAEFRQKVRAIRNWLCSKHSYYRLEDEYNPESFRLGIYKSGLEVEPIFYNRAGRFELSFDCKPQRFLFTGEEVFTLGEWGETETYSGSIVSFDGTETTAIKSLKVNITPKQSGSGDPSPSNVRPISGYEGVNVRRFGKNLLEMTGTSQTINGVTFTVNADKTITVNGTSTAGIVYGLGGTSKLKMGERYILSGCPSGGGTNTYRLAVADPYWSYDYGNGYTFTKQGSINEIRLNISSGVTLNNLIFKPMIRVASDTDDTYEPYNGTTYTTSLGQTVYGGTLDVVSGKLTVNKVMEDITDLSWSVRYTGSVNKLWVAGMVNKYYPQSPVDLVGEMGKYIGYVAGASILQNVDSRKVGYYTFRGGNNIPENSLYMILSLDATPSGKVVFNAMTPTEIQLTPTEVKTLLGSNNIWADAGTVEVEIGENPNILVNPTPFESSPVFEVEGSGTLTVGNVSMNIVNSGTTIIDSEMMEAYEEENGAIISRNDSVSGEFPKLESGNNNIETVGLTSVKVTPKWYEV